MIITLRDLIKIVPFEEVKRAINYHYPDDKNDYSSLYESFKDMEGEPLDGEIEVYNCYIGNKRLVNKIKLKEESFLEHNYINGGYGIHLMKEGEAWGIDFCDWNKVVNTPINRKTLNNYTFVDILAHFIWEITFYGTEKQAKEVAEEINQKPIDRKLKI